MLSQVAHKLSQTCALALSSREKLYRKHWPMELSINDKNNGKLQLAMTDCRFGQYNAAIGSRVPNSIDKYPEFQKIKPNRDMLKREQLDLLHILREKMHLDVTELVPEEKTPLCSFVEDLGDYLRYQLNFHKSWLNCSFPSYSCQCQHLN